MNKIFEYPLYTTDEQRLLLPIGCKILTIQAKGDYPCLWAMVDPSVTMEENVTILMFGTGHKISHDVERMDYISTFKLLHGGLVFHAFKKI